MIIAWMESKTQWVAVTSWCRASRSLGVEIPSPRLLASVQSTICNATCVESEELAQADDDSSVACSFIHSHRTRAADVSRVFQQDSAKTSQVQAKVPTTFTSQELWFASVHNRDHLFEILHEPTQGSMHGTMKKAGLGTGLFGNRPTNNCSDKVGLGHSHGHMARMHHVGGN